MSHYPELPYPAAEITRYIQAGTLFSMLLQDDKIVHFEPDDVEDFIQWLHESNIRDVKKCP